MTSDSPTPPGGDPGGEQPDPGALHVPVADPASSGGSGRRARRNARARHRLRRRYWMGAVMVLGGAAVLWSTGLGGSTASRDHASPGDRGTTTAVTVPSGLVGTASGTTTSGPPRVIDNRVFVVGDSVMQAAAPFLAEAAPAWSITADTRVGRFTAEGVDVVEERRREIGEVAVVALGNNYSSDRAAFAADVEAMMSALEGVDHVLWFTVAEFRPDRAEVNEVLRLAAALRPNLVLVDWNDWWGAERGFTGADHLHLTEAGARALAALTADAVEEVTRRANQTPEPGVAAPRITTNGRIPDGSDAAAGSDGSDDGRSGSGSDSDDGRGGSGGSRSTTSSTPRRSTTTVGEDGPTTTSPSSPTTRTDTTDPPTTLVAPTTTP